MSEQRASLHGLLPGAWLIRRMGYHKGLSFFFTSVFHPVCPSNCLALAVIVSTNCDGVRRIKCDVFDRRSKLDKDTVIKSANCDFQPAHVVVAKFFFGVIARWPNGSCQPRSECLAYSPVFISTATARSSHSSIILKSFMHVTRRRCPKCFSAQSSIGLMSHWYASASRIWYRCLAEPGASESDSIFSLFRCAGPIHARMRNGASAVWSTQPHSSTTTRYAIGCQVHFLTRQNLLRSAIAT